MKFMPNQEAAASRPRLDSWKSIAIHLGKSMRTVQRWEAEEGLPVHRLAHEQRGSVYAHVDELDTWWQSKSIRLMAGTAEEVPVAAALPSNSKWRRPRGPEVALWRYCWPVLSPFERRAPAKRAFLPQCRCR